VVDAQPVRHESRLERRVIHGLEHHEFVPYYQPIIELATGQISGFEALARWSHSKLGILSPAQFIEIAEQSRLIIPLGEQMLRTACKQIVRWRKLTVEAGAYVSVNVSACQLDDRQFRTTVRDILRETGAPPASLQIEVTETFFIRNEEYAIETLRELADLGVRIAIDDFGIGYSSLNSLQRLPIHTLKIDKTFVRDLSPASHDAAIVRALLAMARGLDLKVVAEGVETNAQLGFLRKEGCDAIQGYLVSRPLPPDDATVFISTFDAQRFRRAQRRIMDTESPPTR
jgi:EAL domain-containing protein (putative c-di-GMP-specific phosphodiesterase class I)